MAGFLEVCGVFGLCALVLWFVWAFCSFFDHIKASNSRLWELENNQVLDLECDKCGGEIPTFCASCKE